MKLAAKYFGPFEILAKVGEVSYKLKLPDNAKIHPVFHVSQLKQHVGAVVVQSELPMLDEDGLIKKEPIAILDCKMVKRNNIAATELLVQWRNTFPEDSTWELFSNLQTQFPGFNP